MYSNMDKKIVQKMHYRNNDGDIVRKVAFDNYKDMRTTMNFLSLLFKLKLAGGVSNTLPDSRDPKPTWDVFITTRN